MLFRSAAFLQTFRLSRWSWRLGTAAALLYAIVLSAGIEIAQAAFPPHVPDISDVLTCTAGAVLGLFALQSGGIFVVIRTNKSETPSASSVIPAGETGGLTAGESRHDS